MTAIDLAIVPCWIEDMHTADVMQPMNYTINGGPVIVKVPTYTTTPSWCPVVTAARELVSISPALAGPDLKPLFFLDGVDEYMMINEDYSNSLDSEDFKNRFKDIGTIFTLTLRSTYFTSADGGTISDEKEFDFEFNI